MSRLYVVTLLTASNRTYEMIVNATSSNAAMHQAAARRGALALSAEVL